MKNTKENDIDSIKELSELVDIVIKMNQMGGILYDS